MEKKKITLKEIGIKNLVLILLSGIFLIVVSYESLPKKDNGTVNETLGYEESPSNDEGVTEEYIKKNETKLKEALSKVSGVGKVEVMITVNTSSELVTLQDKPYSKEVIKEEDGQGLNRESTSITNQENTILAENSKGTNEPYIIKEIAPKIEGVLVVAQGGDNPVLINEITQAVEVLFGVPVHKIKVMKMNTQ